MLDEILAGGVSLAQLDWRYTVVFLALFPFVLTYIITSIRATVAANQKGDAKSPPIVPYAVPLVGNLWSFAFDTEYALRKAMARYAGNVPARFRVANRKIYIVSGITNVLTLFRSSRELTTAPSTIFVLESAFGSPETDRHLYTRDNTGIYKEPLEGTGPVAPHNRVFHLTHQTIKRNLVGLPLVDLIDHFVKNLAVELDHAITSDDWVDIPDFYGLVQATVFKASTTAIYGPHIFSLNPTFAEDFWNYDQRLPNLFKNLPRFLIPKAYAVRDRLHAAIMKWHKHADEHIDWEDPELPGKEWEEYFGARIMRERAKDFRGLDGTSEQMHAASDLGMLWAANSNIIPTIGWCLLDILSRPELESRTRAEIASLSPGPDINMETIVTAPVLQAVYAEELRLRGSAFVQRVPIADNFKVGPWKFPKDSMVVVSSWHEGRNKDVWNEHDREGRMHSVDEFWPDRFLTHADDPLSGPRKVDGSKVAKAGGVAPMEKVDGGEEPKFTTETVTGAFVPYGGGQNGCPGRFYAKQEAIAGMALFLSKFDIELKPGPEPKPDMEQFAFGVLPPKEKTAARIRRKKAE